MGELQGKMNALVVWLILLLHSFRVSVANSEGDALHSLRANLRDPNNVLQSWDLPLLILALGSMSLATTTIM
ncbi:unnamed protein product [Cuscuta campestris]|uniref:Leucine-rich repeat-containing N-terminal plant-type domain-containing protein n=1 Tax=Cuscuta campestris TaxID=132261 RepID=A0A484M9W9_9ASTE|nr:unnamed protein product [Cuscuta campestris]